MSSHTIVNQPLHRLNILGDMAMTNYRGGNTTHNINSEMLTKF